MRKIRDVSEDEMIAIYLQTELSSVRFQQKLELHMHQENIDTRVIQEPDWHNAAENVLRRTLLGVYRGYGQNTDYFPDFPAHVRWERVGLSRKDVGAPLVVMEGHARLTAYLIAPECIPTELEVIIGYSEQMTDWECY